MTKSVSEPDKILEALGDLKKRMDDLFILQACQSGVKVEAIRAILGIDKNRVSRIAQHVKRP